MSNFLKFFLKEERMYIDSDYLEFIFGCTTFFQPKYSILQSNPVLWNIPKKFFFKIKITSGWMGRWTVGRFTRFFFFDSFFLWKQKKKQEKGMEKDERGRSQRRPVSSATRNVSHYARDAGVVDRPPALFPFLFFISSSHFSIHSSSFRFSLSLSFSLSPFVALSLQQSATDLFGTEARNGETTTTTTTTATTTTTTRTHPSPRRRERTPVAADAAARPLRSASVFFFVSIGES